MRYFITYKTLENSRALTAQSCEIDLSRNGIYDFPDGSYAVEVQPGGKEGVIQGQITCRFGKDTQTYVKIALEAEEGNWSRDNYVFMPAAVYNGNRFESRELPYPPFAAQGCREEDKTGKPVITDIPHLDADGSKSSIQFLSGDMSTPAMGFYNRGEEKGFLILGEHLVDGDYTGFTVEEDLDNAKAVFSLSAPGVREEERYYFGERQDGSGFFPDSHTVSRDKGRMFRAGDELVLPFRIFCFPASGLKEFFRYFNSIRQDMEAGKLEHKLPIYRAYQEVKEKYQQENYLEEGYYGVGTQHSRPQQCWQAGWVGGGMNNYAFLLEDDGLAYDRGLSTFRFILDKLMLENGWVCGVYADGTYYGDNFELNQPGSTLLVRKCADLLYFLIKELEVIENMGDERERDREKVAALADAFVRLFRKYGQLGQFIDIEKEEILIGGSASAAMAAGALALAGEYLGNAEYLETAKALGELYYHEYVAKGILNGGPGEICQAPDSESAFALLESYVQLCETTGEEKWMHYAEETFELAVTWVVSYDFTFPTETTAARREIHTLGTVFANAQNKHSAPGICTLSGNSLLKLYRFSGDHKYLYWLSCISHNLTQSVSMKQDRIYTLDETYLPSGYMNERVQMSDWEGEETVGEFLDGSNWPEVSMMLTYVEIPGVYVDVASDLVQCFDHVECQVSEWGEKRVTAELKNPTEYDTYVTMLIDDSRCHEKITRQYYKQMQKVFLYAGEKKRVQVKVNQAE